MPLDATELLAIGQQLLQQQGGEQPTVCFALLPLLIPAGVVMARSLARHWGRWAPRPA